MDTNRKSFAFKLADKKPQAAKWRARDGVSMAGCTLVGDGHYWDGPIYMRDGKYEC